MDRELLGRVAALTSGQQRWLRTVLQSIFTMEASPGRSARRVAEEAEMREERPRQAKPKTAKPAPAEEPRRQGLDKLLSGEGAAEEYPELADELKGIGDIADLLREGGRERRRFGEELMRLFGSPEADAEEGEEDEGEGARFN